MSKKVFDNIDDLWYSLVEDVENSVRKSVDVVVKHVYKEKIQEAYDSYMPKHERSSRYRRGESGSFHDNDNHVSEITRFGENIRYMLHNERTSDCNCNYCKNNDTNLDGFIEEGIAGRSSITPRPVSEWVMDELESNRIIDNTIDRDLKKKGW